MHASSWLRALSFLAAASLFAVGCKQAEGEPCDRDTDCATGFVCSCDFDGTVRGVCVDEEAPSTDICPDASVPPPDSGVRDAGRDAAAPVEAGVDAGMDSGPGTDDAGTDGGTDASTPAMDAGSDAGADAG